jgi:hypothetical protein
MVSPAVGAYTVTWAPASSSNVSFRDATSPPPITAQERFFRSRKTGRKFMPELYPGLAFQQRAECISSVISTKQWMDY